MRAGWALDRDDLYGQAGVEPKDIDFVETYDDYPVISLMQLEDLGFCGKGEGPAFVRKHSFTCDGSFPLNTSGGQLSVGQAGAAGGFLGMVEAIRQLTGEARRRSGEGRETGSRERLRHDQLRPWPRLAERRSLQRPKRKNPVLRTRLPTLPPAARSRVALGLTAAAALGRFELQQCRDCGTVQYPPREACQKCLSSRSGLEGAAGRRRAARADGPASQQRSLLPRAPALAPRAW